MIPISRLRDAPQRPLRVSLDGRRIDGGVADAMQIMRERCEDPKIRVNICHSAVTPLQRPIRRGRWRPLLSPFPTSLH